MNLSLNIDLVIISGLPLTQENSGNFKIVENLRKLKETQGSLKFKKYQENFFLDLEQGSAGQKGTFFMCLKNNTLE